MKNNRALKEIIKNINNRVTKIPPNDASELFDKNTPDGATMQQFCRLFNELTVSHGLTNAAVNDFLCLLRDTTTSLRMPLNKKNSVPFSGTVNINRVMDYVEEDYKGQCGL